MTVITDVYPSRVGREAAILMRQDPVVWPGKKPASALSREQLKAYTDDGAILLERVFSEKEVAALRKAIDDMTEDPDIRNRDETIVEPGSGTVRSIFLVHRLNDVIRRLAADRRIADVARQILGSDVYVHQSRANLKRGFEGQEFYWHSDFETWHIEDGMPRMRALSCSILLDDNNAFNGPLMVMPGSHLNYVSCVGETPRDNYKESLKKQVYGTPDHDSLRFLVERGGIRSMTGPAGSVVFFDCNTMHGSNRNLSPYPRSNVFFVYNSVENRLDPPHHGLDPRPEYIAARDDCEALVSVESNRLKLV